MLTAAISAALLIAAADTSDWAAYGADEGRTNYVEAELPGELKLCWVYKSAHPPQPAWPRSPRMKFDRANHAVVAGGMVFVGDSVDGTVSALDLKSGEPRWTFFTEGPVRFAPVVAEGRVFVASDDGRLYALDANDGQPLWEKRGGPGDALVLGNERVISKWPARGGPLVVDDTVYFAAGIWPSEGIYLYALDVNTGQVKWVNDDAGGIYMPQPHGGANAASGVSAQGYLAAAGDKIFVPTGRAVPAAFDRATGEFLYFHLQKFGKSGGAGILAVQDVFFNGGQAFSAADGESIGKLPDGPVAATAGGVAAAAGGNLYVYQWQQVEKVDRKGNPVKTRGLAAVAKIEGVVPAESLIVVGNTAVVGGAGRVDVVDLAAQKKLQSLDVEGTAYELAFADGRLLASTSTGQVMNFGKSESGIVAYPVQPAPDPAWPQDDRFAKAAEEILLHAKLDAGYVVDLGCGGGELAYELAKRSSLRVIAVADGEESLAARMNLRRAGVYGSRVEVFERPLDETGLPPYLANLVVSSRTIDGELAEKALQEAARLQRPEGGIVALGPPGSLEFEVRGPLAGAGQWTHQYADAGNSANSGDALVKGRPTMHWFRDFDFDVPQRHGRAPAPLYKDGRLFHEGLHGVICVDAYNGSELWRYDIKDLLTAYDGDELMGAAGTGGNCCIGDDSLYVRDGGRCLRIDAATGTLLAELEPPPAAGGKDAVWGYIAHVDGILYGTLADPEHVVTYRFRDTSGDLSRLLTESKTLFALDAESGRLLWRYDAKDSIRHNAIAIGKKTVCLIDRPAAVFDRVKKPDDKQHSPGTLLALDGESGEVKWQAEDAWGTLLAVSAEHDAVLTAYQPTRFRLDSEIGGRMAVHSLKDGREIWRRDGAYSSRPTINAETIYAEGGAWDLLTGEPRPFEFRRSYGCGVLAGCRDMLLFRSATLGYFDLTKEEGVKNYGGMRPGCWINAIPAGGLVLVPDASAGCTCSYLNRCWFALVPEG